MDISTDNDCPRFRPFASPNRLIKVKKAKYSTSLDPRGYIPVYEYTINGQPIMWDRESGYVHFTGIWKSLGNSKADIVKMVDSNPELKVKKIRGGFLKIQGTWIPYEYAHILCKRTAWNVRKDLVAMFGPRFATEALDPSHPEYGCLLLDPKNAQYHKGSMTQRRHSYTTMRQANHPYKREYVRRTSREKPMRQQKRPLSSMSLSRLLNQPPSSTDDTNSLSPQDGDDQSFLSDEGDDQFISPDAFTESPNTTPSPTFRIIPSFSHIETSWNSSKRKQHQQQLQQQHQHQQQQQQQQQSGQGSFRSYGQTQLHPAPQSPPSQPQEPQQKQQRSGPLLPPIYNLTFASCPASRRISEPRILPVTPSSSSSSSSSPFVPLEAIPSTPTTPHAQDIIETINATLLLQRLSQDDGARPFRPMQSDYVPSKVVIGDQEFRICWDD